MKRIVVSVLALGLAATAATAATAADLPARKFAPVAPVAIAPVFTWTGFYVGVNAGSGFSGQQLGKVGWGYSGKDMGEKFFPLEKSFGKYTKKSSSGFTGGGQIGYNYQAGSVILGVEADINYANVTAEASGEKRYFSTFGAEKDILKAKSTLDWYGTVRPRIGVAVSDRFMVFATGGLAFGGVTNSASFHDTLGGKVDLTAKGKKTSTRTGWTLGAGAEYALTDNLSLKGEYAYVNLGSKKFKYDGTEGSSNYYVSGRDKMNFHVVRVGLNYKF